MTMTFADVEFELHNQIAGIMSLLYSHDWRTARSRDEIADRVSTIERLIIAQPQPTIPKLEWSRTLFDGKVVTLSEAEEAVAKLGAGWRLPTRQELESLLDLSRHDPAIDTSKYLDTQSCAYWTSTPCAWNSAGRWVVDFDYGGVDGPYRYGHACVRAVRDVEECA